jgi:lipopolysaccharide export system permease protein
MRLLERYVLIELLRIFTVLLTVITCLLMFVGIFGQMRENGLSAAQALTILPYVIPNLLPFTIPATMLLTVCVVYGRMSGDREIIAAKAAGINVFSILWPSFFLGATLSVVSLLLLDQVIPWSFAHIERLVALATEDIFLDLLRTQNQINIKERGVSITVMAVRDKTLILPTIRFAPNGKNAVTIQAREARLEFDLPHQQVILELKHGHLDVAGQSPMYFVEERRPFPLPSKSDRLRPQRMRVRDLLATMEQTKVEQLEISQRQALESAFALTTGDFSRFEPNDKAFTKHHLDGWLARDSLARLHTETHNRFATACSCFFFVLLGSPFAILMARKQFLTSFLFCFLPILLVYYPISMMTVNLSKTSQLDPTWAVWCANGALGLAALFFFRKVLQH